MVTMLVTKNDRSKARPSSDTSPSATTIAMIASTIGTTAAATAPNTTIKMTRAATIPMVSPLLQVLLGDGVGVLGRGGLTGHPDLEALGVGGVQRPVQHLVDVGVGVVQRPGHGHRDQGGVLVVRHQPVARLVGVGGLLHDRRLERVEVALEPRHVRLELGSVTVCDSERTITTSLERRGPEPLLQQGLGLLGVGVVGELGLGGQRAAQVGLEVSNPPTRNSTTQTPITVKRRLALQRATPCGDSLMSFLSAFCAPPLRANRSRPEPAW